MDKKGFIHEDCVEVLINTMNQLDDERNSLEALFVLLSLRPELCDVKLSQYCRIRHDGGHGGVATCGLQELA